MKISTKSIPRRVPKASKSSKMASRKRLGATLAPRSDFCLIFDPSWRPIWAPRPPQELHKAPKLEPKASQDELQASPNHAQNQYEISTRFWSPLRCQNWQKNFQKTWKIHPKSSEKTFSSKKKRFLKKRVFASAPARFSWIFHQILMQISYTNRDKNQLGTEVAS